jgi:hypothetical protein
VKAAKPRKGNGLDEPTEHYESVQILNLLLAQGKITDAQVEASRQYLKEMS